MVKKINATNVYFRHVRMADETKERLREAAFKLQIPECRIADEILSLYLDEYVARHKGRKTRNTTNY